MRTLFLRGLPFKGKTPVTRIIEAIKSPQQAVFEKLRIGVATALSEHLLDPQVEFIEDWLTNRAVVQIRGFLWGRTIEQYEIRYPLDWWEAVKERWAPRWFLKQRPVSYTIKRISLKAAWPTLRTLIPEHEPRLVILLNDYPAGNYPETE